MTNTCARIRLLGLALLLIGLIGLLAPGATAAEDFGQPVSGRHVYDQAGVLTPAEIDQIEQRAAQLSQAGTPTIIYLRLKDTSYDSTYQDAQELMESWDVQSTPNARDGFVMFLNLKPKDPHHGQLAMYAGKTLVDGNLPTREIQRIFDQDMKPQLKQGQVADGIVAGLNAVERSLREGPPPPPPPSDFEKATASLSRGILSPLNVVALLATALLLLVGWRAYSSRPTASRIVGGTTMLPGDLSPALVGALVTGRVKNQQAEATLLDLARRGALAIEPAGKKRVQLRLLDESRVRGEFEQRIWESLKARAEDGIIPSKRLGEVQKDWGAARQAIEVDLEQRGWYDPRASVRRRPAYIAAVVGLVLAAVAFVIAIVGQQGLAAIGVTLLGLVALVNFILGYAIPSTTTEGEIEATPWRAYLNGIKASKRDRLLDAGVDLDEAMPYALAMGATGALDRRLKEASKTGYAPAWLGPTLHAGGTTTAWEGGFYPYWAAFHSSVTPSSSGGSSGGGASAGGGGGGGGF